MVVETMVNKDKDFQSSEVKHDAGEVQMVMK